MPGRRLLRFNPEPATLRHGIPRIHRKMKQHLFQPFTIDLDIHRRIFNGHTEIDGGWQQPSHHSTKILQHGVDRKHLPDMTVVEAQPGQLSGHDCSLPSASKYVIDRPVERVVRLEPG